MAYPNTPIGYFSGSGTPAMMIEGAYYEVDATPHSQTNERRECERRDSIDSVKSLKSYHTIRESLGHMHTFVDKLFKEVSTSKVLERNSAAKSDRSGISGIEEEPSQNLESINELCSENEHSYIGKVPTKEQEEIKARSILKAKRDTQGNVMISAEAVRVKNDSADTEMNDENAQKENIMVVVKKPTGVYKREDTSQVKAGRRGMVIESEVEKDKVTGKRVLKDIPKVGNKQKYEERFKSDKSFEEDTTKVVVIPKRHQTNTHNNTQRIMNYSKGTFERKGACGICNLEIFYHQKSKLMKGCSHRAHDACFKNGNERSASRGGEGNGSSVTRQFRNIHISNVEAKCIQCTLIENGFSQNDNEVTIGEVKKMMASNRI